MFKIDIEFQSYIPPLTKEEFEQLKENILHDGAIISPFILWNGILIDGHNRYRILQEHPELPYSTHEMTFADRFDAISWICKNQLGRRNLTPEQKKYLLGKQYEAEKRSVGARKGNSNAKQCVQNEHIVSPERTCDRIARENNTSGSYVRRAVNFAKAVDAAEEAVPGTRNEILSGKLKVRDKDMDSIRTAVPEIRPVLVCQLGFSKRSPEAMNEQETQEELEPPQKISESTQDLDIGFDEDDVLCELQDALYTMYHRWQVCLTSYPESTRLCQPKINKLAQACIAYMQKIQTQGE